MWKHNSVLSDLWKSYLKYNYLSQQQNQPLTNTLAHLLTYPLRTQNYKRQHGRLRKGAIQMSVYATHSMIAWRLSIHTKYEASWAILSLGFPRPLPLPRPPLPPLPPLPRSPPARCITRAFRANFISMSGTKTGSQKRQPVCSISSLGRGDFVWNDKKTDSWVAPGYIILSTEEYVMLGWIISEEQ